MALSTVNGDLDTARVATSVLTEPFSLRTWRETVHNTLAFPLGVLWFVVFLTLLTLAAGLLPLALVGLVVLFVTFVTAQGAATIERGLAKVLLDVGVDAPARRRPTGSGPLAQFWARLVDPVTWKELTYLFLSFPLGIASFVAAVTVWSTAILGVTFPLWGGAAMSGNSPDSSVMWANGSHVSLGEYAANFATGVVALFVAPWVMRVFAKVREAMVRVLLGPSPFPLPGGWVPQRPRQDSNLRPTA